MTSSVAADSVADLLPFLGSGKKDSPSLLLLLVVLVVALCTNRQTQNLDLSPLVYSSMRARRSRICPRSTKSGSGPPSKHLRLSQHPVSEGRKEALLSHHMDPSAQQILDILQ